MRRPSVRALTLLGAWALAAPPKEYTDTEHNPMIRHMLVLKPGLVIHRIYNGYWFWCRPSVFALWHDLRAVPSEIRPDSDLNAPGLRDAWNAGDFWPFHRWNRRTKVNPAAVTIHSDPGHIGGLGIVREMGQLTLQKRSLLS